MVAPDYRDFRLTLKLLSPLGTPMQSDTLFGHLVWQMKFAEGEEGVNRFLESFMDTSPPFVLSDAFPRGFIPRPLLPARKKAGPDGPRTTKDEFAAKKRRKKASSVHVDDFRAILEGRDPIHEPAANPWLQMTTPHASIDRSTWTTTPGGQFFQTEAWTLPGGRVDIYLRAGDGWQDRIEALFRKMAGTGFGKGKSIGQGAFEVETFEPWDGFAAPEGADGFVSLSTFMPARDDPVEGRWRLRIKRGRLGEGAGSGNPFKRPMAQFEPGAVFRVPKGRPKPIYGRMVKDAAPGLPQAVQCGYTLAAACRWQNEV